MSFVAGVRLFAEGARMVRNPRLARYLWLPAAVSLAIITVGLAFAFSYIGELSAWLVAALPDWLGFLSWILAPLLYLLGTLIGAWLFGFLAVLVASPFLGDLSIELERLRYGTAPAHDATLGQTVRSAMVREARKLAYHLPRLLLVLIITLIPGVNAIAPAIWFVFGAWTMAVQFADFPGENRNQPFADTVAGLKANRTTALGYGTCASLALAVPLVNFLLIPVAVAGGTLLWHSIRQAPS